MYEYHIWFHLKLLAPKWPPSLYPRPNRKEHTDPWYRGRPTSGSSVRNKVRRCGLRIVETGNRVGRTDMAEISTTQLHVTCDRGNGFNNAQNVSRICNTTNLFIGSRWLPPKDHHTIVCFCICCQASTL